MKVTSKINQAHLNIMKEVFMKAQIKTCDALKSDLQDSQTIPFDTGALQNTKMFVNKRNVEKGVVSIGNEGPYARRLYFHPEYNFRTDKNPNAGGMWFEPYLNGNKNMMPQILFTKFVKKEMQNVIK